MIEIITRYNIDEYFIFLLIFFLNGTQRSAASESHKDLRLTTTNIKLILENPTGFSKS